MTLDVKRLRELLADPNLPRLPWRAGSCDLDSVFSPYPEGIGIERVVLKLNRHYPTGTTGDLIAEAVNVLEPLLEVYEAACDVVDSGDLVDLVDLRNLQRAVREVRGR